MLNQLLAEQLHCIMPHQHPAIARLSPSRARARGAGYTHGLGTVAEAAVVVVHMREMEGAVEELAEWLQW